MYLNPLAPHGDPVQGGSFLNCGGCAASSRYLRIVSPNVTFSNGLLDSAFAYGGTHWLRRTAVREFVAGKGDSPEFPPRCLWTTVRVYHGGEWLSPTGVGFASGDTMILPWDVWYGEIGGYGISWHATALIPEFDAFGNEGFDSGLRATYTSRNTTAWRCLGTNEMPLLGVSENYGLADGGDASLPASLTVEAATP